MAPTPCARAATSASGLRAPATATVAVASSSRAGLWGGEGDCSVSGPRALPLRAILLQIAELSDAWPTIPVTCPKCMLRTLHETCQSTLARNEAARPIVREPAAARAG